MANSNWLSRCKEEPVNSDPPEIVEKEEEENWEETREAYELFKVNPIQKEGESEEEFTYRRKSLEFQKQEYQEYWKEKIKNYLDARKSKEDKEKRKRLEKEEDEGLMGQFRTTPEIHYGLRGGKYRLTNKGRKSYDIK